MPTVIISKNQISLIIFFQATNVHFFKHSVMKYSPNILFKKQELRKIQTKKQQGRKFIFQKKKIQGYFGGKSSSNCISWSSKYWYTSHKTVKSKFQMNFGSSIQKHSSPLFGIMSQ